MTYHLPNSLIPHDKITPQFKAHKHQIRIVDTDADDEEKYRRTGAV